MLILDTRAKISSQAEEIEGMTDTLPQTMQNTIRSALVGLSFEHSKSQSRRSQLFAR